MKRALLLTVCSAFVVAATVLAEEPFGVSLFRPDSLLGWEHAEHEPAGWTMTDGVLRGTAAASPLVSGFAFGDFELRWQWTVANGGVWNLSLYESPKGPGLAVRLCEGDRCGALTDAGTELAPGGPVGGKAEGRHDAVLRRADGKLELVVDGDSLWSVEIDPNRRFVPGLALIAGEGDMAEMRVREPAGEPLFNGTDLTGWWTPGKLDRWQVEDGQIVRTEHAGDYLRTDREFGNFTVSLEYQMKKGTNSGLGLRTRREGWPSSEGMELQMLDQSGLGKGNHMALYGAVPAVALVLRSEQWNRLVVKVEGYMVTAWDNGELVQHYNTQRHPELRHRGFHGWLGFQDHGSWTRFRNIHLLEAPEGAGMDLWRQPGPRQVADVMDRAMNPWLLAAADGMTSGAVDAAFAQEEPGEHVLAELTGPGAVVRMARNMPEGTLAFYFDGEDKPRIEAKTDQLRAALPHLSDYQDPIITCLPYAQSLRIVLRDAKQGECRIDYVTVPADYQVRTFESQGESLPRGWSDSVVYRQLKYRFGDYRNPGLLPRIESEKTTLAPGEASQVLALEGAGIVRYVRLRMNNELLNRNHLWLDVAVDGESEPAVSAPVRFWLAGLTGPRNYYNLAHFSRNGLATTQAMPFGAGMTFTLRNAGEKAIKDVSIEVCVEPAEGERATEVAAMMRLRGAFLPAGEAGDSLARYEGAGRLVAMACQLPDGPEFGIAALDVDGQPRDGFSAPNLDLLLGKAGDFQASLSGRAGRMAWRYFWLAPVEFRTSLNLRATSETLGDRLALFYVKGP